MKYYLIAGEASGDLHAGNLLKEINHLDSDAITQGWGGDTMQAQGMKLVKHYRELAFMGFAEVIKNLPTILRNISFAKADILEFKPDVLILIDYPGFNLRIADWAHGQGIRVVYYISPQIWAWKESRVHKIIRSVDKMLVILPFEKEFYAKYKYPVEFVGHPLLDAIAETSSHADEKILALLPGSRKQEIKTMLPIMVQAATRFKEYKIKIACAPSIEKEFYTQLMGDFQVDFFTQGTHALLRESTVALVTSGTATLETALFNVPQVVCYKGSYISYQIAKRLVTIKYISLVNLILDKPAVKELIQGEMNVANIQVELQNILPGGSDRKRMLDDYSQLKQLLGQGGASARAAQIICDFLKK